MTKELNELKSWVLKEQAKSLGFYKAMHDAGEKEIAHQHMGEHTAFALCENKINELLVSPPQTMTCGVNCDCVSQCAMKIDQSTPPQTGDAGNTAVLP